MAVNTTGNKNLILFKPANYVDAMIFKKSSKKMEYLCLNFCGLYI